MIFYSLWSNIFIIRILIIINGIKKINSIFDTESKIIQFMGSNKYIITKIMCWPVFKQDPTFLDVVYIGSINPTHHELAKMFLNAGKPVLCEKPLCMSLEHTEELIALSKEKNVFLMEVNNHYN